MAKVYIELDLDDTPADEITESQVYDYLNYLMDNESLDYTVEER